MVAESDVPFVPLDQPFVQRSLARFYKLTSLVHVVRVGLKDIAIDIGVVIVIGSVFYCDASLQVDRILGSLEYLVIAP
jgi:hypothetical protein